MYAINDELYHHGIKGQKWGIRRYQNEDGTLTPAGEKRYGRGIKGDIRRVKDARKTAFKELDKYEKDYISKGNIDQKIDEDGYIKRTNRIYEETEEKARRLSGMDKNRYDFANAADEQRRAKAIRGIGIGMGAVSTALAGVGGVLALKGDSDEVMNAGSALFLGGVAGVNASLGTIGAAEIMNAKAKRDMREINSR